MTAQTEATAVQTAIVVEAPIERAFRVFTEGISTWWPPEHHLLQGELAEMVFEPRVGGHIYDRGVDGSECRWARVLAYDPPSRVVFSWDINTKWALETDTTRRARSRSPSHRRHRNGLASCWSTAISSGTARVGSRCATRSARTAGGRSDCAPSPLAPPADAGFGAPPRG